MAFPVVLFPSCRNVPYNLIVVVVFFTNILPPKRDYNRQFSPEKAAKFNTNIRKWRRVNERSYNSLQGKQKMFYTRMFDQRLTIQRVVFAELNLVEGESHISAWFA